MEAVVPIIENGFVISLIIQNEYEGSGGQYRNLLDVKEEYGIIMVLEWGEEGKGGAMGNPVGSSVRAQKHYDKMAELVKVCFHAFVSNIMGNKVVCVIPTKEGKLDYTGRLSMIEKARNLTRSLKKCGGY